MQFIGLCPLAGEVVRRALRGVNAAADGEDDVAVRADLGVGFEQHVIEVDPRVVAACVAVLDLHDDLVVRVGGSDLEDVANLLRSARLERDVREAIGMKLGEELAGLVYLRDTRGDTHAVEGSTSGASLRHDASLAELQVPQVAVEEHGVELRSAAWLQVLFHHGEVSAEDLVGVHAAAGHLGPVPGVGCCGHDLAIS